MHVASSVFVLLLLQGSSVGTWFDNGGGGGLSRPEFSICNSAQCKLKKIRGAPAPGATVVPTPMQGTYCNSIVSYSKDVSV